MSDNNYLIKEFLNESSSEWDNLLFSYSDYNIYQTYAWGELKKRHGWRVLRLVCYKDSKDVALLQAMFKYYKLLNIYVIWIPGGPVFLKDLNNLELNGFRHLILTVLDRFKDNKYYLRIYPLQDYDSRVIIGIREMGFQRPIQGINCNFSYYINTSHSEEEILNNLSSNWRHNLKRSAKKELAFEHSDSQDKLFEFYQIYLETSKSNKIKTRYSTDDLKFLKENLFYPNSLKLFLSMADKRIISGRVIGVINKKAYDLVAAVTDEGRRKYSTYPLIYKIIDWCRINGIEHLDMSGIDPFDNKEVYNFKKGIGGNFVEYIGEWEFSNSWLLRMIVNLYIAKFLKD